MTTLAVPRPVRALAIAFTAFGEPISQGSKKTFIDRSGNARLIDDNKPGLRVWRREVTKAAKQAMAQQPCARRPLLDGPLAVRLVFTFNRPKSVKRTTPSVRPDWDKLARAVNDSITDAKLWADDGRGVEATVRKVYVGLDPEALPRPGVRIAVWSISEAAQPTLDGDAL